MASMPVANDPAKQLVFLLGKRDVPTDGVCDYCESCVPNADAVRRFVDPLSAETGSGGLVAALERFCATALVRDDAGRGVRDGGPGAQTTSRICIALFG